MRRPSLLRALLLVAPCLLAPLPACAPDAAAPATPAADPRPTTRVLMVGVDGLEWSVLRPLLRGGRCPNLLSLMERGSYGRLGTFVPTHSPIIWTSIATGKDRTEHGILDFIDREGRVYTSSRRKVRALWNIADRYGLSSDVIGWWVTWPVEPIQGVMVSATSAGAMVAKNWKGALVPGVPDQVYPPELEQEILDVAEQVGQEDNIRKVAREKVFIGLPPTEDLPDVERELIDQTLWSILSDETYFQVARKVLAEHPADLNMVYFGGTDVVGHRFWRHYMPWEFDYQGESPEVDAALMCTIPNYYVWIDEMLGELIQAAGGLDDGNLVVMVLSDHGMHENSTHEPNRAFTTGDHQDAAPGVLVVAGPGIRQQGDVDLFLEEGGLPPLGSVFNIAPDVLALLGLPQARDMQDQAYKWIFTDEALQRIRDRGFVDTHDEGFRAPTMVALPEASQEDFKDRMAALGYVLVNPDGDNESALVNPATYPTRPPPGEHPCD